MDELDLKRISAIPHHETIGIFSNHIRYPQPVPHQLYQSYQQDDRLLRKVNALNRFPNRLT